MSVTHTTKCVLCPPEDPFRTNAGEFATIPMLGEEMDLRLQFLFGKLEKHLHEEAQQETKRIEELQKRAGRNGSKTVEISPHAIAKLIAEKARHSTQIGAVPVFMNLARVFMVSSAFETTDPQLNLMKENVRAHLHRETRKNILTDDTILHHVAQLGLEQIDADAVFALLKEMRDILTEAGQYAPGQSGTEKARSSIIIP